jgi:succinate-semialdehyde dehydrogenase/glutarate-semialdehyde dehydrogenase
MTETVPASARRSVESRDPATGEVWRTYAAALPDEIASAVAAARNAQREWGARPVRERARMLERFRRVLFDRRREVADLLMRENGKPAGEAMAAEVATILDFASYYAREAPRVLGGSGWRASHGLAMWRKRVRITYEPYGVVAVIAPWNYPFLLAAGVTLPALVAGNSVILKPSELTPSSGMLLGELLRAAGVPPGVITVLPGDGATGAALIAAGVDKVSFTGSVATGRRVAVACAEQLLPCSLELGGSDPAIVLEDADVEHAARGVAWGRFTNAGQTCVAPKRVFVVASRYDAFVDALRRTVAALHIGPGAAGDSDVGPLIRPSQVTQLRAQLDDALARGARILAQAPIGAGAGERFFPPTVLGDVTTSMRVLNEETFGPLLPVIRVRDLEDAVRQANASTFGLSASIWTGDHGQAAEIASRLEAGTVAINDVAMVAGMADVPHGGVKASGLGRAHGLAGLLDCVRTKTVVADRWPRWRQPWWFRYSAQRANDVDAFARMAHGSGLRERLGGVRGTVRMLRARE